MTGEVHAVAHQCHGSNVGPMGTLRRGNGDVTSGVPFLVDDVSPAVTAKWAKGTGGPSGNECQNLVLNSRQDPILSEFAQPIDTDGYSQAVSSLQRAGCTVRRLTPRECERLQGFPDDWTLVGHKGKPASDGPRYRAIGNSMAVPVMAWIGERIAMVERGAAS